MKEYQARTKDGKIESRFGPLIPLDFCQDMVRISMPDCVLVLAEWETEAEADRARIQYIQEHGIPDYLHFEPRSKIWQTSNTGPYTRVDFIQWLDIARNAPKPTVTVIPT